MIGAGRGVDLVVAAEEARVVVGDLLVDRVDRGELAVLDQPGQQLGVVDDLVVAAELGVLAADGVEAVRAGRDDLLPGPGADSGLVEGLDVLLGEHLEDELVAQPAGGVAGAGLGRAEDRELDPGGVQQLRDGLGGLLRPVLQRPGAADPVQVLHVVGDAPVEDGDLEVELGDPVGAAVLGHAPGVAAALEVVEHGGGLGRERGLDQDLVAAHPVDVVDVLDVDRALLDAGAAVGAGPQRLGVDDPVDVGPAHQRPGRLGEHVGRQVLALGLRSPAGTAPWRRRGRAGPG